MPNTIHEWTEAHRPHTDKHVRSGCNAHDCLYCTMDMQKAYVLTDTEGVTNWQMEKFHMHLGIKRNSIRPVHFVSVLQADTKKGNQSGVWTRCTWVRKNKKTNCWSNGVNNFTRPWWFDHALRSYENHTGCGRNTNDDEKNTFYVDPEWLMGNNETEQREYVVAWNQFGRLFIPQLFQSTV